MSEVSRNPLNYRCADGKTIGELKYDIDAMR